MKSPTILIADDNPHIAKLLTMNLEKEGFHIIHATDGEEALRMVNAEKPDLVISDVMMPRLDGIALCQRIRTESSMPMVPFMFLTSIDADVTQKRGFRAGADHYLIKSEISRDVLVAKVNDMLKHVHKINQIGAPSNSTFTGDLSELSLIEILQLLHIHKKSGRLTIRRPRYPEAVVTVRQGDIVHAELGEETDEKALLVMSVWKRGEFTYEESQVTDVPKTITSTTEDIIMESCRMAGQ